MVTFLSEAWPFTEEEALERKVRRIVFRQVNKSMAWRIRRSSELKELPREPDLLTQEIVECHGWVLWKG